MVTLGSGGAGRAFSGAVRPGEELDGSAGGRGWGGRDGLLSAAPLQAGPAPPGRRPARPQRLPPCPQLAAVRLQRSRWAPRTGRSVTSTSRSTGSRVSGAGPSVGRGRGGRGRGRGGAGRGGAGRAGLRRPELPSRRGHEPASCPSAVPREPSLECPGSGRRGWRGKGQKGLCGFCSPGIAALLGCGCDVWVLEVQCAAIH